MRQPWKLLKWTAIAFSPLISKNIFFYAVIHKNLMPLWKSAGKFCDLFSSLVIREAMRHWYIRNYCFSPEEVTFRWHSNSHVFFSYRLWMKLLLYRGRCQQWTRSCDCLLLHLSVFSFFLPLIMNFLRCCADKINSN